jgi:hypothetical protein
MSNNFSQNNNDDNYSSDENETTAAIRTLEQMFNLPSESADVVSLGEVTYPKEFSYSESFMCVSANSVINKLSVEQLRKLFMQLFIYMVGKDKIVKKLLIKDIQGGF